MWLSTDRRQNPGHQRHPDGGPDGGGRPAPAALPRRHHQDQAQAGGASQR